MASLLWLARVAAGGSGWQLQNRMDLVRCCTKEEREQQKELAGLGNRADTLLHIG